MRSRFGSYWLITTLLVVGLFAIQAFAQTIVTGDLVGIVTDPSSAVVANATVTLTNTETGVSQTTTTSTTGLYRFSLLKPGNYKVVVTQSGFRKTSETMTVAIGTVATANIQLQLGQSSETVEVTGAAPLIQTENANIETSLSSQQVDLIPNSGNDLTAVAYTAPGVVMSTGGGYGNFTAFGLPATSNLFTLNGNDEMDPYLNLNNSGASNLLLGKNEVQEVAVVSNGYTGQYGRQAGAQIDYATKSGSNTIHGNAMYWWNGRTMNANDWFNNATTPSTPRPFVNNNQYAARVGGPIKKDKAFFFADYEGLRYILATSSQVFVPNQTFANAVLGNITANDPAALPFYQNIFNLYEGAPGLSRSVPVDASFGTNLGCGDLTSAGAFAAFGDPASGGGGTACANVFRSTVGQPAHEWIFSARTDLNITNNDKLFLRYKMDRGLQPTSTDPVNALFNATSNQPQYEGQINYTRTITPTTINSFIGSVSWYSAIFDITNRPAALAAFPYFLIENTGAGWATLGASSAFPQGRKVTQYQITDDLSLSRGSHEFKLGVNFRRNDITDGLFGRRTIPQVYIDGGHTGSGGMDLFVDGLTGRIRQYFPEALEQPMAIYSLGAYFQDTWRAKSNLKFTLTLRADRNSNLVCQTNCISRFEQPFTQSDHDSTAPFNQLFTGGLHSLFPNLEKVVFQPRFGFAWNPGGMSNTVIRGGVGLFSDLYPATLADSFALNSPTSNRFLFRPPTPMPISPADTANPNGPPTETQITACNSAFNSTFFGGGTLADYQTVAPGCAIPDYNSVVDQVKNPKFVEWNVEIQHSFGSKTVASVNYVGNRGYDIFIFNPWVNTGAGAFGTFTGLPATSPESRVNNVSELNNSARSYYNGVTASLTERLAKGFQAQVSYTYSHATDDVSNGGVSPFNLSETGGSQLVQLSPQGLATNYGNADYDVRHNLSASYVWELPFKSSSGIVNQIIGGWSISGTVFARSGYPFSALDGFPPLLFQNGVNATEVLAQFSGVGPTSCGKPKIDPTTGQPVACLDAATQFPDNFNVTETGFATTRRNSFRGPHFFDSDLDLLKRFKVTERVDFAVGANFYNVFNHPNFQIPNNDVNDIYSAPFGTVTSTAEGPTSIYGAFAGSAVSGRVIQLHARIEF
ncbi:MAG: carboxypeptidase-like regulatory domain-containing protein [Candidatus Sulfotelmatobacter sp.]